MTHSLSPTLVLPALATLHTSNAAYVGRALQALRDVYFPHASFEFATSGGVPALKQSLSEAVPVLRPKRVARLVHQDDIPDSGYASAEEDELDDGTKETRDDEEMAEDHDDDEKLEILRSDEFERGYAVRWLTGLVKRGDAWICGTASSCPSLVEQEARTKHLEDASRLLARFAGDNAPEEALTRTFVFSLHMSSCRRCHRWDVDVSSPPITIELNDAPVDGTDHTAVGLQSWGSVIVFAERMCADPERYLGALRCCASPPAPQRRVLELGAGTGLLSIVAAQILSRTSVQAKIDATDYHLGVLENLARNVRHNQSAANVSVDQLDWCAVSEGVVGVNADGLYDVVLAADVVYCPEHAGWLRGCVGRTLKKRGVFWLMIPVRTTGRHMGLGETVEEAFPIPVVGSGEGERLAIVRREEVQRLDGVGRADEGGYTLFEIRWVGLHFPCDASSGKYCQGFGRLLDPVGSLLKKSRRTLQDGNEDGQACSASF